LAAEQNDHEKGGNGNVAVHIDPRFAAYPTPVRVPEHEFALIFTASGDPLSHQAPFNVQ